MAKVARKTAFSDNQPDIEEQIRARAYELYQERGGADGYDVEDWLTAESEICGTRAEKAAA